MQVLNSLQNLDAHRWSLYQKGMGASRHSYKDTGYSILVSHIAHTYHSNHQDWLVKLPSSSHHWIRILDWLQISLFFLCIRQWRKSRELMNFSRANKKAFLILLQGFLMTNFLQIRECPKKNPHLKLCKPWSQLILYMSPQEKLLILSINNNNNNNWASN